MVSYNLQEIIQAAEAAEDNGGGGDFLKSTLAGGTLANGKYNVKIKNVKVVESNNFGLPGFGMVCEFTDGDHKGEVMWLDSELTTFDFNNKRVLSNLRALGVTDELLGALDQQGELIAQMLTGKECEIKVVFKPNKKKPEYPYQNHVVVAKTIEIPDIPEDDEDDDDY